MRHRDKSRNDFTLGCVIFAIAFVLSTIVVIAFSVRCAPVSYENTTTIEGKCVSVEYEQVKTGRMSSIKTVIITSTATDIAFDIWG